MFETVYFNMFKVVFVNISIIANYYYRLYFPLFYDNLVKMVFVIRIQSGLWFWENISKRGTCFNPKVFRKVLVCVLK